MILKKLTIENFGRSSVLKASFNSQLAVIPDLNADEIVQAIGFVTNNKTLSGLITKQMQADKSYISAELEIKNEQYLINTSGQPQSGTIEYKVYLFLNCYIYI